MPLTRTARSAFTLVELLVVIAIMTLLLALMMPSLGRARELAKTTTCLANMKGIASGVSLYAGQNNDVVVPSFQIGAVYFWGALVQDGVVTAPLVKTQADPVAPGSSIFRCPSGRYEFVYKDSAHLTTAQLPNPTTWTDPNGQLGYRSATKVNISNSLVYNYVDCWYSAVDWYSDLNGFPCSAFPSHALPNMAYSWTPASAAAPGVAWTTGSAYYKVDPWTLTKISNISQPGNTMFAYEGPDLGFAMSGLNARHNQNTDTNVVFFDGHAETLPTTNRNFPNAYASTYTGIGSPATPGSAACMTVNNLKKYLPLIFRLDQ